MSTTTDNPTAFFDSKGVLRSWLSAEPLPADWTGIAKRKDVFFHIGKDNGEMSYTALQAKSVSDALTEAKSRGLAVKEEDEIADPFFARYPTRHDTHSVELIEKGKALIAAIGTTSRHRHSFAPGDHSADRCLAEIASSQAELDLALFLRDNYPQREGPEFNSREAGVHGALAELDRVIKVAERLHPGLNSRFATMRGDSIEKTLDQATLNWSMAMDREALVARIEGDIARLRKVSIEPVSIKLSELVDIEVRPAADDDRVLIGRSDWGYTVVNYNSEGVILDVYAEGELHPVHTANLYCDELESSAALQSDRSEGQG